MSGPVVSARPIRREPARRGIDDVEPHVAALLDAKRERLAGVRDCTPSPAQITPSLENLIRAHGEHDVAVSGVRRTAGDASSAQFGFTAHCGGVAEKLLLRLDPPESIVENCRYRETEILGAMTGRVPTPTVRYLDGDGTILGAPGTVTSFVDGETWSPIEETRFLDTIIEIHATDWQARCLPHFDAPTAHPRQAASWQVNRWSRVWRDDQVDPIPLVTLAECWLREHLPTLATASDLVVVHGDYHPGNIVADASTGRFTAVLGWEFAHIGDFHEDLAVILQRLFPGSAESRRASTGTSIDRDDFLRQYQATTDRTVDPRTLAFYEVLAAYRGAVTSLGTAYSAAVRGHGHQDVLLTSLSTAGHTSLCEMARIIERAEAS